MGPLPTGLGGAIPVNRSVMPGAGPPQLSGARDTALVAYEDAPPSAYALDSSDPFIAPGPARGALAG